MRTNDLWVFAPENSQGDPLRAFLTNVWDHVAVLGFGGDPNWQNNYAGRPMLNPWEAFFLWLGVGIALWHWQRRPSYRLLFLWTVVMLLPAVLAHDAKVSNTLRMTAAAPAIYLLLGVGVWEVFRFLKERFFELHGIRAGIVVGSVVGIAVLTQGIVTHRTYFTRWAVAPEVRALYNVPVVEIMEAQRAQMFMPGVVYLLPFFRGNNGHNYLYNKPPVHILQTAKPHLPQTVESVLAKYDGLSIVKVVEWGRFLAWERDEANRFIFLLSKYGRYQGSEEYADYRIHNYTDISLERSWSFYEELEPLTVVYDGGIALHGLALGQGAEQMSSRQALDLGRGRPLWMTLQWQTVPGLDVDYAISLRLYNEEGARVYQEDSVLWNPRHFPTSYWSAEAPVETLALLAVPADLPYGDYELRVVVYDFETQVPTVQESVWEPELTLTRLRLAEVQ